MTPENEKGLENECRTNCGFSTARETSYVNETWDRFLLEHLSKKRMVPNVDVDTIALRINGQVLPVNCNFEGGAQTSWVASLRNTYGPYARAEIDLTQMKGFARWGAIIASKTVEGLLKAMGVQGGLYLNNWLISTNLYAKEFEISTISMARYQLAGKFRKSAIVVRSLVPSLHQELMRDLIFEGFHLIPTRQVWLLNEPFVGKWRTRSDSRKDLAFEKRESQTSKWIPASDFSDADYERAAELYEELYRKKYPEHNPIFNEEFIRAAVETGWMEVWGLRQTHEKKLPLCGVIGVLTQGDWMSCPLLGYDLKAPVKQGLYRRTSLKTFMLAEQKKKSFHCSGGAGDFKHQRGAQHDVEYAAVYVKHISPLKEFLLKNFSKLMYSWAVPYMKNHIL